MDFSKLPKFSKTDVPPNEAGPSSPSPVQPSALPTTAFCQDCGSPMNAGARFCPGCGKPLSREIGGSDVGVSPEAWLSIAIGIILLLMFQNFPRYAMNPTTKAFDATNTQTGEVIPYTRSAFFLPDMGVSVFALVLIVTGLLMIFTRAQWAVKVGLVITALAAALNLWALISSMPLIGFSINCALAVAFSIYLMISQVASLKSRA